MTFFEKLAQKLFPSDETNKNKEAFVTEKLIRNEKYKQAYFKWINEGIYRPILDNVHEAYQQKIQKNEAELKFHLLTTPYANGFALSYHSSITSKHFSFIFDYLKDQAINAGYIVKNTGRKIYDRPNYVETKEKYYLKPPIKSMEDDKLFNQLYGNISIEYILIDEKPSYIKLVASIYSDRLYTNALPFEELIKVIFGK